MTKYFVYSPRMPGIYVWAISELEARKGYVRQTESRAAVYVIVADPH